MSIAVYGGCFNPPHLGHRAAAGSARETLKPEKLLVLPDREPPHKEQAKGEPTPEERLELCRLTFQGLEGVEVSDLSLRRPGPSYMSDTLRLLQEQYPGQELILILGADMLPGIERWHEAEEVLHRCSLAILTRDGVGERELEPQARLLRQKYGTRVRFLPNTPVAVSSARLRCLLPHRQGWNLVDGEVYARIVQHRWYETQVSLPWLRSRVETMLKRSRIAHVKGCEKAAARLAEVWGEDPETAMEAAIMHDMTKRWGPEEQIEYCRSQGIPLGEAEERSPQVLHAITGAAEAKRLFGASDEVCSAIRWHTTGKPEMSLLEQIVYLADVTEETRDFPGVEDLRRESLRNIEKAMAMAARSCVEELERKQTYIHPDTIRAYRWYAGDENKEESTC